MYTYNLRNTSGTTSSTAYSWGSPYFSVRPGARAIRIRGLKFDFSINPIPAVFALVVRRGSAYTTGGSAATPYQFTLDTTANPLFSAIWSASGSLTPTTSLTDAEVFYMAAGSIGQTEWTDGDITNLTLPAYDQGSLDVYVTAAAASQSFNLNVLVEENPFKRQFDRAWARTSAIKSGVLRSRR